MQRIAHHLCEVSGLEIEICEQIISLYKNQCFQLINDMRSKMSINDWTEVASLLHKLKGSSGNVCATKIAGLADQAEKACLIMDVDHLLNLMGSIEEEIANIEDSSQLVL